MNAHVSHLSSVIGDKGKIHVNVGSYHVIAFENIQDIDELGERLKQIAKQLREKEESQ
jgi:hypothetical protein